MRKKTIIFLFNFFFIIKNCSAFESSALKASILTCYGYFSQLKKMGLTKDKHQTLLNQLTSAIKNSSSVKELNYKIFIIEGNVKALKTKKTAIADSLLQGCYKNLKSFKRLK